MFIKDCWQVAAFSKEVGRHLLPRTLCDEHVVFFRTRDGEPVALIDTCPHRSVPLSMGKLIDDHVQCAYHGMCFGKNGECIKVPGQDAIPSAARARSFPAVERNELIWIWLGDPALADSSTIPDFFWFTSPEWAISEGYHHLAAHYQLLVDNLLDLSHESFVHSHSIGNAAVAESPLRVTNEGKSVRARREMLDCEPPPFYVQATGFTTKIDRWHTTIYTPPGFCIIENGSMPAGSVRDEARAKGLTRERRVINVITPESETSSHYFWAIARAYDLKDEALTEYIRGEIRKTFDEDKVLLEAQQLRIGNARYKNFPVTLRADAGAVQGRRLHDAFAAERGAVAARQISGH